MLATPVEMSFSVLPLSSACEDSVHSYSLGSNLLPLKPKGVQL